MNIFIKIDEKNVMSYVVIYTVLSLMTRYLFLQRHKINLLKTNISLKGTQIYVLNANSKHNLSFGPYFFISAAYKISLVSKRLRDIARKILYISYL